MKTEDQINTIFRANDVRGIYKKELAKEFRTYHKIKETSVKDKVATLKKNRKDI